MARIAVIGGVVTIAILVAVALSGCAKPVQQLGSGPGTRIYPPAVAAERRGNNDYRWLAPLLFAHPLWPVRVFEAYHHRGRYQAGDRFYRSGHSSRN